MELFYKLLFICPALFVAGLIDGIAGGGGIISLPSYIAAGLPLNMAYGCNKMQSCFGTAAALVRYGKEGLLDIKPAIIACVTALLGSYISTEIMIGLQDNVKNIIIAVAMGFIIVLTLLTGNMKGGERRTIEIKGRTIALCLLLGLVLGFYDGFFGPGGGTIALMMFTLFFGYDIRVGAGNGKLVVVVSNLIALVDYIANDMIWYEIAIPATACNMIGCYLGAHLAVKNGRKLVKKVIAVVALILVIQGIMKII